MRKRIIVILSISICLVFGGAQNSDATSFPSLYIDLNQTSLSEIASQSKEQRYPNNTVRLLDGMTSTTISDVELKGRGNSTWLVPKRPFQLSFKQKTGLLDLGKSKKWVLLADAYDPSHTRNELAFYLAELMDIPFTNQGRYIDLFIDNQYQGLYYLTPKIGLNKNSVNLTSDQAVLVEMDNSWGAEDQFFKTHIGGHAVSFKDFNTNDANAQSEIMQNFTKSYRNFERALYANDWSLITKYIDVDSFARYFLMYEISTNLDGLATSFFMYQNGPDTPIHAGPIWDYDLAFRLTNFDDNPDRLPYFSWGQRNMHQAYVNEQASTENEIFSRLLDHAEFRQRVSHIFRHKIAAHRTEIDDFFTQHYLLLHDEAERDSNLWEELPFETDFQELKDWLNLRLDYLTVLYGTPPTDSSVVVSAQLDQTRELYLRRLSDQSYQIIDLNSNKALQAANPSQTKSPVWFSTPRDNDQQHWYIVYANEHYYFFAKTSGLMLTSEEGTMHLDYFSPNPTTAFSLKISQNPTILLRQSILSFHQNVATLYDSQSARTWLLGDIASPQLFAPELIMRGGMAFPR